MDLFVAGCQGLGLALAAGIFAGASGRRDAVGTALLVIAVIGGAILIGLSLETEDHPAWPGWPSRWARRGVRVRRHPRRRRRSRRTCRGQRGERADHRRRRPRARRALDSSSDRSRSSRSPASPGSGSRAASAPRASTRACGRCGERPPQARPLHGRLAAHRHPAARRGRGCGTDVRRAARARRGRRGLRRAVPVGDPRLLLGDRHRHRRRPPLDLGLELVPPLRAALRRVRQLVRGYARLRALPDALRHRLQHEHVPPLRRGGDGVRAARRRRAAAPRAPRS